MNDCFICLQNNEPLLTNICDCNNYVHSECLLKTVKTVKTHASGTCPICQKKYNNLIVDTKKVYNKLWFLLQVTRILHIIATIYVFLIIYANFPQSINGMNCLHTGFLKNITIFLSCIENSSVFLEEVGYISFGLMLLFISLFWGKITNRLIKQYPLYKIEYSVKLK